MGTWGHNPFENDEASDLLSDFNETKDITMLEHALDAVCNQKDSDYLEVPAAERAIAAAKIIIDLKDGLIKPDHRIFLLEKIARALKRILDKSELEELWAESPEHGEWVKSVDELRKSGVS